ncbi:hypothetical protein O181_018096 [Austropuccinia psidii MF-1]|uniref:Tc1-like transposase DDE domain-containing protein n=1 Tax=Austropuccinia psidii MF-1 TaxID=1389203 RepID=A0A9Q3C4L7_9BASI|nr:hypothetical protein [Austropuccinia psidii MF-1]
MTHQVSTRTIQRKIHKFCKHLRIAPKKPYLRPQYFEWRLAFAQAHRHWTIKDWAWVVWMDESAFELGKKVDWVRVWRTPQEKWNFENLAVKASWYGGHFVRRSWMEQAPWICGHHCLLLMEDNAPIHTARASTDWQDWHKIQKLDWPAHSPDLNPIKNVWKTMKSQMSKLYQPQTVEEL